MSESILIEIRASEGGTDSKLLVSDFCDVYMKVDKLERL